MDTHNLILIGMPGSGKSTVGRVLANALDMAFVDTDALVEQRRGVSLQAIVDAEGPEGVLCAEADEALRLDCRDTVIATGGSMVYSETAMKALEQLGPIIWLDVPLETLKTRVGSGDQRGLAMRPDQGLADLATERLPLYQRHATLRIDCNGLSPEEVSAAIVSRLSVRTGT
ncbi:shikimate kinase [Aquisalimonas asiatica]|uniref:Shikimate kinase n=1 Tax=Aquisalimonas asiatica TaxID=406100 RepID=A0A1H8TM10_9GAMM|nr:shikimate kinase [Aquisalimonas asiatica]SEO91603.1 shikimate kinase [Aquisalimonas asiatica]